MRKIIVPSDFSDNAFNALKYATELFKYEQSDIILLHTNWKEKKFYSNYERIDENLPEGFETHKISAKKLKGLKDDITQNFSNPRHSFRTHSCSGHLVDEVNNLADKENADIIVMGTRGKTNDRNLTFGSNTLQVVKYVQCPVLCIPESYKFLSLKGILFPTNYLLPYQKRELKLVAEIARQFCAGVDLLYISKFPVYTSRQKENQVLLKEAFYNIQFHFYNQYSIHKVDAIVHFIGKLNIDLLVMVNSRQTYLESFLAPSTVDKISLKPKIPFLILQNFNRRK